MTGEHQSASCWVCSACQNRNRFDKKSEFVRHLEENHHADIAVYEIPAFTFACSRVITRDRWSCPLCSEVGDTSVLLGHIAEHMHSFSLVSLPLPASEKYSFGTVTGQDHQSREVANHFTMNRDEGNTSFSLSNDSQETEDLPKWRTADNEAGERGLQNEIREHNMQCEVDDETLDSKGKEQTMENQIEKNEKEGSEPEDLPSCPDSTTSISPKGIIRVGSPVSNSNWTWSEDHRSWYRQIFQNGKPYNCLRRNVTDD